MILEYFNKYIKKIAGIGKWSTGSANHLTEVARGRKYAGVVINPRNVPVYTKVHTYIAFRGSVGPLAAHINHSKTGERERDGIGRGPVFAPVKI